MQPSINFEDLTQSLGERFRHQYEDNPSVQTRMVGIVFARPNSSLARTEIIPQLNDWHFRSGNHIDFFFAGYTYPHPLIPGYQEVQIPGGNPWLYSAELFNAFRQDIESFTSWRYGGGCELLLTNSRFNAKRNKACLDFSSTICCRLDAMKSDNAIQSIETFFEAIFRFAENTNGMDQTWGFSDAQGIDVAGNALKRVVLSVLPKGLDTDYKKAEHFVIRNVGNRVNKN